VALELVPRDGPTLVSINLLEELVNSLVEILIELKPRPDLGAGLKVLLVKNSSLLSRNDLIPITKMALWQQEE